MVSDISENIHSRDLHSVPCFPEQPDEKEAPQEEIVRQKFTIAESLNNATRLFLFRNGKLLPGSANMRRIDPGCPSRADAGNRQFPGLSTRWKRHKPVSVLFYTES
jgi:hypothetical protein